MRLSRLSLPVVAVLAIAQVRHATSDSCREEEVDAQGKCPKKASRPAPPPKLASCPAGMVRVPGGTFQMGNPAQVGAADERPQHAVTLSGYCIDKTEVTQKAYLACVAANACTGLSEVEYLYCYSRPNSPTDAPIGCASWDNAVEYCEWAGKRLPTEAEWEYAARGADGRAYPWGNQPPTEKRLNACGYECAAEGKLSGITEIVMYNTDDGWAWPAPVGSFPGDRSPFGVLDMAGNVSEWTADWYGPYTRTAATNPKGPTTGTERVFRGGNWHDGNPGYVRTATRGHGTPSDYNDRIGFRCVRGD